MFEEVRDLGDLSRWSSGAIGFDSPSGRSAEHGVLVSRFAPGIVALLAFSLAACGESAPSPLGAAPGSTSLPSQNSAPSTPLAGTTSPDRELEELPEDSEQICDARATVGLSDYILVGGSGRRGLGFKAENGVLFPAITIDRVSSKKIALREPMYSSEVTDIVTDSDQLLLSPAGIVDETSLSEIEVSRQSLFFIDIGETGHHQVRPWILAIATSLDGELWSLSGECGSVWMPAINAAAAKLGRQPDLSFWTDLTNSSGIVAATVVAEYASARPSQPDWDDVAPSLRSLHLGDIPREHLKEFRLTGMQVMSEKGVGDGFVTLRTDRGVVSSVSTAGVAGVLPVLVPLDAGDAWVTFSTRPLLSDDDRVVGRVEPTILQSEFGLRLTIRSESEAEVSALGVGDLEKILNLTTEDVSLLKEQLLANAYPGA